MAGSKRAKLKKALSPSSSLSPPPPPTDMADDDELMDDLLAQLDSRDTNVQATSSDILQEMQEVREPDAPSAKSAKDRFKERQVSPRSGASSL